MAKSYISQFFVTNTALPTTLYHGSPFFPIFFSIHIFFFIVPHVSDSYPFWSFGAGLLIVPLVVFPCLF